MWVQMIAQILGFKTSPYVPFEFVLFFLENLENKNLMKSGKIKWFNIPHGYGFIERADNEPDVFGKLEITQVQVGILTEHNGKKISFNSQLHLDCICSVRILLLTQVNLVLTGPQNFF